MYAIPGTNRTLRHAASYFSKAVLAASRIGVLSQ